MTVIMKYEIVELADIHVGAFNRTLSAIIACILFACIHDCNPLPGNQILISKYLAGRGVVVSGGWSNGSGWQQTTK